MTKMSLKGKIAVVTGSAKGIGFAISKEYAENNDITVIVCSRVFKKQRVAKQINGNAFAAEIDIACNASATSFLQQVLSNHGRICILIINAGYPFNSEI
jgi:NAD(P)-dependent dehydrogenase (short-subunit alcohol dehydrogenase family)